MNRKLKFTVLATTSVLLATLSTVSIASAASKTKPKLNKQVKVVATTKNQTTRSNFKTHKRITKSRILRPEGSFSGEY